MREWRRPRDRRGLAIEGGGREGGQETAWGLTLVLVLALAMSAGCAQIAEKAARGAVEKATGVKVDEKNDSVTVTGKDGEKVSFTGNEENQLPKDLPADFPVYDGTPDGAAPRPTTPEGKTITFNIVTSDKVSQVFGLVQGRAGRTPAGRSRTSTTITINGVDSANLKAMNAASEAVVRISGEHGQARQGHRRRHHQREDEVAAQSGT